MKKVKLIHIIFTGCLAVFCVSSYMLISQWVRLNSEQQVFNNLSDQINAATTQGDNSSTDTTALEKLKEQNNDLFGWISIASTPIDYPVMHSSDDAEFYLNHSFDKKSSISGTPFISKGYTSSSLNTIIYGHKMEDDTMFSTLLSYANREYHLEHPVITYNTLAKNSEYEIFAAFYSEDYSLSGKDGFMYYNYYNVQDKVQYGEFVANCKASAIYDTDITPIFGEELITLSTCSYHKENGRFVVVAKAK